MTTKTTIQQYKIGTDELLRKFDIPWDGKDLLDVLWDGSYILVTTRSATPVKHNA